MNITTFGFALADLAARWIAGNPDAITERLVRDTSRFYPDLES
jgi:hypothetical protein